MSGGNEPIPVAIGEARVQLQIGDLQPTRLIVTVAVNDDVPFKALAEWALKVKKQLATIDE